MSADLLYIDFESRSIIDLPTQGVYKYATHPSTGIWCMGWALNDESVKVWYPDTEPIPSEVVDHVAARKPVIAHNAPFELTIWNHVVLRDRNLSVALRPEQMICTLARAYAMALPGSLEQVAPALGLRTKKDTAGHALMLRMCRPINAEQAARGAPPRWVTDEPEFVFKGQSRSPEWAVKTLGRYCAQDVVVERVVYKRTQALSPAEQRVWLFDRTVNTRGVAFDLPAVRGALHAKERAMQDLNRKMKRVTKGEVRSCGALQALKAWAADYGVYRDSLASDILSRDLEDPTLPKQVRKAFELRKEAGRATSVAKLATVERLADPHGRVREITQYHGASTGRFAGRMIQPHNFPRDLPAPENVAEIMAHLRTGQALPDDQPVLTTISQLLRGFIVPGRGRRFIGGDYSNIEGRVLAWLAGEGWKLDAFRTADKDPDIDVYMQSYSAAFGIPASEVDKEQRQLGKVMELALGYAGGAGAFQTMARAFNVEVTDTRADTLKVAWRDNHPNVVRYWYAVQEAAIKATRTPGKVFAAGPPHARVSFRVNGSFLWFRLPSGRYLCYPYPKMVETDYGPALSYKSVPDPLKWGAYTKARDAKALDKYTGPIVHETGNTKHWARQTTYGGKLVENCTQAAARDLFVAGMLRLDRAGYKVVLHIHDEIIVEGKFTEQDRVKVEELMCRVPGWARGMPVAAGCWLGDRYQK